VKTPKIAPPPPNPDWLERLLDMEFSQSASLKIDRWIWHYQMEWEVAE
jgi:hypothetical protein